jgi:hypothetical protein
MFFDRSGTKLVNADTLTLGKPVSLIDGRNEVKVRIGQLHLKPGVYNLALAMAENGQVLHNVPPTFPVEVVDLTMSSLGKRPEADGAVTCSFELVPTG